MIGEESYKIRMKELQRLKEFVQLMAIEPPYCENVGLLKKWIEGFEACQSAIIYKIDYELKSIDK